MHIFTRRSSDQVTSQALAWQTTSRSRGRVNWERSQKVAASEQHGDITFGKIDTEDQQGLAAAAQITSIPTLMAFRDGVLVFSQAGALPAASLEKLIQAVRDLDMDQVRNDIAAQQNA